MSKKAKVFVLTIVVALGLTFYVGYEAGFLEGYSKGAAGYRQGGPR